jgi:hypothetical protein
LIVDHLHLEVTVYNLFIDALPGVVPGRLPRTLPVQLAFDPHKNALSVGLGKRLCVCLVRVMVQLPVQAAVVAVVGVGALLFPRQLSVAAERACLGRGSGVNKCGVNKSCGVNVWS